MDAGSESGRHDHLPDHVPSYLPYTPADLKAIEYGKDSYNQKRKRDEVVIKSYLLRKNDTAVESVNSIRLYPDRT